MLEEITVWFTRYFGNGTPRYSALQTTNMASFFQRHNDKSNRPRDIYLNAKQSQNFQSNKISTSKYSIISFFPKFFYEQFRRYANLFFLLIALLQQIPDVSPTGRYTTAVPLTIILLVSAIKEIYEDIKRRRMDSQVNSYYVEVVEVTGLRKKQWKHLSVGEIVKICENEVIPADLVLLSSSEELGTCYIETSSLDGETSLKMRQALEVTNDKIRDQHDLNHFYTKIECEPPSRSVNEFTGTLRYGEDINPLGIMQFLLRGARLKNTRWVYGGVVYTGHDTRLLQNSTAAPLKASRVDELTNHRIIILFIKLLVLSLVSALGAEIYNKYLIADAFYLGNLMSSSTFMWNWLTFFILYNNLIPISLQVTLELVRFYQAIFINEDINMYDEENDVRANARTSNLNEELGQVKFLMTDKTGTLTKNVMKFKQCSVGGIVYGRDESVEFDDLRLIDDLKKKSNNSVKIEEFLTSMSVCHTVVPERTESSDEISFQATSPDEGALVRAASTQGFIFKSRKPREIVVETIFGDRKYELLDIIEFSSDRKRMSVILKENGQIKLYCKGADNVIFERLNSSSRSSTEFNELSKHLKKFSVKGYRTLVFASKIISNSTYFEWSKRFQAANLSLDNRAQKVEEVAEEIEVDMNLVGATAIEDKLQDDVPLTITKLLEAKIRIWVLTGDKRETAVNIAQSSSLVKPGTKLFFLDGSSYEEILNKLKKMNIEIRHCNQVDQSFTIVINGSALNHTMVAEAKELFKSIIMKSYSVICCRMTPMQKAEIVQLVRKETQTTVLAVGDGANDVAMIQAASVGVGITGREGLQAASASDYAIGQFRFLQQLLLVHGLWSVERNSKVILYCFYKNICLYLIELWFAFFSTFSGQTVFERWTIALFNVLLTALPPFALGLFDRPVSQKTIHKHPYLYATFHDLTFSHYRFSLWVVTSILHSISVFFFAYFICKEEVLWSNGRVGGWLMFGNTAYTVVIIIVSLKALIECDAWNSVIVASCAGSVVLWLITWFIYSLLYPKFPIGAEMSGTFLIGISSPVFWQSLVFVPIATLLFDFVIKALMTNLHPSPREKLQIQLQNINSLNSSLNSSNGNGNVEVRYSRNTESVVYVNPLATDSPTLDNNSLRKSDRNNNPSGSTSTAYENANKNQIGVSYGSVYFPNSLAANNHRTQS